MWCAHQYMQFTYYASPLCLYTPSWRMKKASLFGYKTANIYGGWVINMDFSTWQHHTLVNFAEEVYLKMKDLQEEVARLNEKLRQCSCDEGPQGYEFTLYPPGQFPPITAYQHPNPHL